MFKAKDLRERTPEDLRELEKTLSKDSFQNRFKNFTNRLDDTSAIKKARKDLARVKTVLAAKLKAAAPAEAPAAPTPVAKKASKKAEVKSAESASTNAKAGAAPKAPKKSAKKTAAKDEAK